MKEFTKEQIKEMNEIIYNQLSYAETKHAVLVGLVGAAIFAIVSIIVDINDPSSRVIIGIQIGLGYVAFSLTVALLLSLFSFLPKLNKQSKTRAINLYFYGDIANYIDAQKYVNDVDESVDLSQQLAEQNIVISQIIMAKHKKFKIALNITIASLIPPYYLIWATMEICNNVRLKREKKQMKTNTN